MGLFDGEGFGRVSWQVEAEKSIAMIVENVNPDIVLEAPPVPGSKESICRVPGMGKYSCIKSGMLKFGDCWMTPGKGLDPDHVFIREGYSGNRKTEESNWIWSNTGQCGRIILISIVHRTHPEKGLSVIEFRVFRPWNG